MKKALSDLNTAIFGWGSPVTLGFFRAVFCSLVTINLLMISIDFGAWFTEDGYVPAGLAKVWQGRDWFFSPLTSVTDSRITMAFMMLVIVAGVLSALGLFSRVATIVLAVGMVTLHHRNPYILHGGDTLMRSVCIYLAIAPSGLACSLDRMLILRKNPEAPLPAISLWPQRLLQYQWALVYLTTAWAKAYGHTWHDGTAVWYPPQISEFHRFNVPAFIDQQPMMAILTYGTLIVEVALATLVFSRPWRKWVLLSGVLLHLGIEWRLNIPLFAFLMMSGYLTFYEGEEMAGWLRRMSERYKLLRWVPSWMGQEQAI
ncbi:MAG: HTTM domain-containing protein [Chthonomonas sp.]|nr:HTTM domain-containing protein [Chthonomonas sp.]